MGHQVVRLNSNEIVLTLGKSYGKVFQSANNSGN